MVRNQAEQEALKDGGKFVGRLSARPADVTRVKPFRWAWERRVLLGYVNLLVGDEGVGKGTFLAWLIARFTRGELPGDLRDHPARVLIVGDEDGFDGVWTPRLLAAGADLDYVLDLPVGKDGPLDLRRDSDDLAALLAAHEIRVVVFDQLLDNLGVDVDDWRGKQVREAIGPLRRIAHELDVAPIAALHTNKVRTGGFRSRVAGTQQFNALSRSSLMLAEHPEDPSRRVLVRGKGNYSVAPQSIEFSIDSAIVDANGYSIPVGTVADVQAGELTIGEVIGEPAKGLTKADRGRALLTDELSDGEWHKVADLIALLGEAGIGDREVRRLADDLGVEKRKSEGFQPHALWRLARGGALYSHSSPSSQSVENRSVARPATPVDRHEQTESSTLQPTQNHSPA